MNTATHATHTPGPWVIAESAGTKYHQTAMRRIRCANEGTEHGAVCEVYGISDGSIAAANARLIASAPELLACLTRLVGIADLGEVDLSDDERDALKQARLAIASATGQPANLSDLAD